MPVEIRSVETTCLAFASFMLNSGISLHPFVLSERNQGD
jgi:hypothetical protein